MQYVKCFVGSCIVHESDESSNDVSNDSSDDDEDKMWTIYQIISLLWLVFAFLLNQMIQHTMFPTIHLRMSIQKNYNSILCHMDTLFFPNCIHTDMFYILSLYYLTHHAHHNL